MRVKILKRSFAGAEFAPDVRVLKVGGQSSAGVEKLEFELPAEWQGLSVTLHVQWLDGTLPAPVLLDDEDSVAVDKTLTASPGGQWMLLALGADGYRALTKPTKYECYSTLNTDGDVEISPTQYETFVARVLEYSNTAQQAAASAKTNAETAATAATRAVNAKGQAETAARTATAGAENSENSAARAEAAAARAEAAAPETGKVVSVNGKGGAVHLTAEHCPLHIRVQRGAQTAEVLLYIGQVIAPAVVQVQTVPGRGRDTALSGGKAVDDGAVFQHIRGQIDQIVFCVDVEHSVSFRRGTGRRGRRPLQA